MDNKKNRSIVFSVIKEAWRMQWEQLKTLYIMQLLYVVVVGMVLSRILGTIFGILLKHKGYSYFTAEMLLEFFTDPIVIFTVLLSFVCIGVLTAILHAFVYQYIEEVCDGEEVQLFITVGRTVRACYRILRQGGVIGLLLLVGSAIFQNILTIILACRYIPSLWYVIKHFLALTYTKPILFGCVFLFLLLFYRHSYTVAYVICEKRRYRDARGRSLQLLKNGSWKGVIEWLFWIVATCVLALGIYLVGMGLAIAIIMVFVTEEIRVAVFVTIQGHMYLVSLLLSSVFGMTVQVTDNILMFYRCKELAKEERIEKKSGGELPLAEEQLLTKRLLAVVMILVLTIDIIMIYDRVRNGAETTFKNIGNITITAHRGDSANAPENTIPAIAMGIDTVSDCIEIDVQETKDGEIVLMHDYSMKRTTGHNRKISDLTYEEIAALDAGSWYDKAYEGTRVPTLREVLELCKGRCMLNIEIKASPAMPDLEEKVVSLIEEYDFTRQCVVTSVYKNSLRKVKKYNEEIKTGYILSSAYGRYYLDKEIDFLSMRSTLVSERVVRLAHKHGKEVFVWTVNSKKEAIRMSQLGVDDIITDRPVYIRKVIYQGEDNGSLGVMLRMLKG